MLLSRNRSASLTGTLRQFSMGSSVRKRIETLLEAYRERFLPFVPGQTREEKRAKIRLLFPSMAGVLMMARVSPDPQRREQILMEARDFFLRCFAYD